MTTRLGAAIGSIALLVGVLCASTSPSGASAPASSHRGTPWVSVTLSSQQVQAGQPATVRFCWHNAPIGWIADFTTGPNPSAAIQSLYTRGVRHHNQCFGRRVVSRHRGVHPYLGRLITPRGHPFSSAGTLLYVYAPIPGPRFLSSILFPHCDGKGNVVVDGGSHAFTCSMDAITSHLTKTPTSCRGVALTLASTDAIGGDTSSKGKSVFEIAQNVYAPFFKYFHDNTIQSFTLRLIGSEFWVAFKSNVKSSRLYFLDEGTIADCYTSTGKV